MDIEVITAERIEAAAKAAGRSLNGLCRDASVPRSVFTRWKQGRHSPSVEAVNRLIRALQEGVAA